MDHHRPTNVVITKCSKTDPDSFLNERTLESLLSSFNLTDHEYDILKNISNPGLIFPYNPQSNPTFCYCEGFREFSLFYKRLHGYLGLAVCLFGVLSNLLNIIVLSRREMAVLPINRILRWLAVTDITLMVEYIPFIFFYYIRLYPNSVHSYKGAVFTILHLNITQILHTVSIFMTLALAFWRYTVIKYPQRNATIANRRKCNRCFALAYALPIIFCLPTYFIFAIKRYDIVEDGRPVTIYAVHLSDNAEKNDELFFIVYLWIYAVIIKLVPCVILTLITCWLIKTLRSVSERRNVLIGVARTYSPTTTNTTNITTTTTTNNNNINNNNNKSNTNPNNDISLNTVVNYCCNSSNNANNNCEETLLVQQNCDERFNSNNININNINNNNNNNNMTTAVNLRQHRIDRTTRILIAVLVLFIITELPQGILGLLSGIYGKKFFTTCYVLLGDLMDLLALFNGAVNFILYCWMSKQFRKTFGQLFKPTLLLSNLIPPTQEIEMVTTNV